MQFWYTLYLFLYIICMGGVTVQELFGWVLAKIALVNVIGKLPISLNTHTKAEIGLK